ncbi:MAG TPA: response regulator transcription factor [Anaerolineales bacterium]|nr:response regulator transcription factor [Anaerolineales bacterium]HND47555.1 response regulator transcription factor [Anaerolineales bacterium]HNE06199.1 response regulator transcription factor [Anaerolineales bacterium]
MLKIIIADDHQVVRRGLTLTINAEKDMRVVGEAQNGAGVLALIKKHKPDVVLMDLQMPEMTGVDALKQIRPEYPDLPILILTSFTDDAHVFAALRAGASGFLLKEMNGDDLVAAIRGAAQGKPQLHPDIAKRLMARAPMPDDPFDSLTERERGILKLLAKGKSNKEIAGELSLTEMTVKGYVSDMFVKLGVNDRTQAALMAVRYGLVLPEEL